MYQLIDTTATSTSEIGQKHLLLVTKDSTEWTNDSAYYSVDDPQWTLTLPYPQMAPMTINKESEHRFDGIPYKPPFGDYILVQVGFLITFFFSIIYLTQGRNEIGRSIRMITDIFQNKRNLGADYLRNTPVDVETSTALRVLTVCYYSLAFVFFFDYYSTDWIKPLALLTLTGQVTGACLIFVIFKHLIDYLLGKLYNTQASMSRYLSLKQALSEMSGFFLWVILIGLVYIENYKIVLFYMVGAIFLITKLIEWIAAIVIFSKGLRSLLDFILYLCTAEIIPYILFYKLIEYFYTQSII